MSGNTLALMRAMTFAIRSRIDDEGGVCADTSAATPQGR
jgi:hypothetical protein